MRIRPKGEAMITKIPRITCKVISYNNELLLSVRICPVGCGLPVADVAEGNSTDRHGSGDGGTVAKADVTEGLYCGNFRFGTLSRVVIL